MKIWLSGLLVSVALWGYSQQTMLQLTSNVWPPFTNESGKKAIALSIVTEALSRAGYGSNHTILTFDHVMEGIEGKRFHGSAALWKDEDRSQYLAFSKPYLKNRLILIGKKGTDVSVTGLDELSDQQIAIIENYAYGTELETNSSITFIEGKNNQENLDRLLADEVDYMLVDALLAEYLVTYQSEEASKYLSIGSHAMLERDLHFAIRKDFPDALKVISAFNNAISKMVSDGSFNRILELNWIKADIDGDGTLEMVLEGDRAGINQPTTSYALLHATDMASSTQNDHQYHIQGTTYQDWNEVPKRYKVPTEYRPGEVTLMIFRF